MNITVVVLHYENIKDTRECLDSLKKYLDDTKNNINIVVVDNGSIKEKTAAIEKEYLNDKIHFIESGENLGFAKGNNIGFHYAKYELHSDIIILANNDLIFQQVDIFYKAIKSNQKSRLYEADGNLATIRFYLRFLANEKRKLLSKKQQQVCEIKLAEVGSILNSWIKK